MNQFGIGITIASTMTYVALKFGYCSFSKITATCRYAEYPDTRYLVPGTGTTILLHVHIFMHHHAHPGLSTTNQS